MRRLVTIVLDSQGKVKRLDVQRDERSLCGDFRAVQQVDAIDRARWHLENDGSLATALGWDRAKEVGRHAGLYAKGIPPRSYQLVERGLIHYGRFARIGDGESQADACCRSVGSCLFAHRSDGKRAICQRNHLLLRIPLRCATRRNCHNRDNRRSRARRIRRHGSRLDGRSHGARIAAVATGREQGGHCQSAT
jgi:hypothetical protein